MTKRGPWPDSPSSIEMYRSLLPARAAPRAPSHEYNCPWTKGAAQLQMLEEAGLLGSVRLQRLGQLEGSQYHYGRPKAVPQDPVNRRGLRQAEQQRVLRNQ
ncbi:hypothetical protein NDU88_005638 [Pleurodeles waltl]|uniref:Uncharacterized protein n=1 Tax=Pleurodeles waltl TaxID=8319 RepID=A0AAV7MB49_PLEWA|nr:hypothetical protein NDU88_005638 [Pleurodeles waltl]